MGVGVAAAAAWVWRWAGLGLGLCWRSAAGVRMGGVPRLRQAEKLTQRMSRRKMPGKALTTPRAFMVRF